MGAGTGAVAARVTSADVAQRAGVSRATVSYVLNDRPGHTIPEPTRRRVREAAAELGYVPNHSARSLRGKRPPLILFVTRGLPFGRNVGAVGDSLTAAAAEAGYSMVTWDWGSTETFARTLAHLAPQLVVSIVPLSERDVEAIERLGIPLLDGWVANSDRFAGSEVTAMQVDRLVAGGRRRIAYVGAEDPSLVLFDGPRREGVLTACRAHDLPAPRTAGIPVPDDDDLSHLVELLAGWTAGEEPVDGIACYNDLWAAAVMRAARLAGLSVPEDVAVIGVDDEPFAPFLEPPLTSVSLEPELFAAELFAQALRRIDGATRPADSGPERAPLRLVPRASA